MKILVTGATGFLGNLVVENLLNQGLEIVATGMSLEKAKKTQWYSKVIFKPLDESNINDSVNYFDYFGRPDKLIHLAWANLPNYKEAFHLNVNLPNQKKLLRNLIKNGLTDITVSGTCLEYGMNEGKLDELMSAKPTVAYAIAKLELYNFLSTLTTDISLKWLRLFYIFGEGQPKHSLFNQLQAAINNKSAEFKMSGGEQVRDFLEADKMAQYMATIALQNKVTGIVNVCSGRPKRVIDFVNEVLDVADYRLKLILNSYPYLDYEPMQFWGDTAKLQTIINSNGSN